MNIALNLSKTQLSKLRNGHGIRISPAMVGMGVDLIIDPMTYHNMMKKLEKGKGAIINMGMSEIEKNKMEGTGLFAGSGKVNRLKKANRWRDFSDETARMGIDTARYGYEQAQEAKNPISSKAKKMLGFGADEEMEGSGKKSGKISRLKKGTRWRDFSDDTARMGIDTARYGYEQAREAKNPIGSKAKEMLGFGQKKPKRKKGEKPSMRPAVMPRPSMGGQGLRLSGDGLRMSGGMCCGCGMYNDQFIFADQAL